MLETIFTAALAIEERLTFIYFSSQRVKTQESTFLVVALKKTFDQSQTCSVSLGFMSVHAMNVTSEIETYFTSLNSS